MKRQTFIIAEAGVNHNGRMDLARKLIAEAAYAGADAVKFQTFRAENIVLDTAPKAPYQQKGTERDESQLQMLKKLELSGNDWEELIQYCRARDILFLSTPFDLESMDFLVKLGMEIFKIPSGEITNLPYLRKVGGLGREVIMSTGMATMQEIKDAVTLLKKAGTAKHKISILHCNTQYPTPMGDVNLRAMVSIAKEFDVKVGYSDHTLGIEIPIAAVALGATIIEKHFTLDKTMPGPDHPASLEPKDLQNMVTAIRNVERAMGSSVKKPSPSEKANRNIVRKSIVASSHIKKGECFTDSNLTCKRPGTGLSPMAWDKIIGTRALHDFHADEMIKI